MKQLKVAKRIIHRVRNLWHDFSFFFVFPSDRLCLLSFAEAINFSLLISRKREVFSRCCSGVHTENFFHCLSSHHNMRRGWWRRVDKLRTKSHNSQRVIFISNGWGKFYFGFFFFVIITACRQPFINGGKPSVWNFQFFLSPPPAHPDVLCWKLFYCRWMGKRHPND